MIDEKDFTVLDMRYKRIEDCDREMHDVDIRHHELDKQFSIINTKLSALLWGVGVLGSAVVGVLVKIIFKAP